MGSDAPFSSQPNGKTETLKFPEGLRGSSGRGSFNAFETYRSFSHFSSDRSEQKNSLLGRTFGDWFPRGRDV